MRQSEKALVESCGGYCGGYPFYYLAFINDDEVGKRKAEEFSKQFNVKITLDHIGCLGCHGSRQCTWCANCSIRQCTE
ncbi:MAG: DUF3795 domain-containing protein [Candidatus Bathyarchaeota archaeon]|nr:DUF3795 domain-containing protein [Candidatus Bathyarchaeota archaeon]